MTRRDRSPARPAFLLLTGLLALAPDAQRVAAPPPSPRPPPGSCGSDVRPAEAPLLLELEAMGMYRLPPLPELVLTVPVTCHVVRPNNGCCGLTEQQVDDNFPVINAAFQPVGIRFERAGAVDFIDNNIYYDGIVTQFQADQLRRTNVVPNTINLYFVEDFSVGGTTLCGQSSFTTSTAQGVLMDNQCTASFGDNATLAHELGHYFDLYHTHETAFGDECPDGSNCATAGDLICDTPADPNLTGLVGVLSCTYNGTGTRCGQPFAPQVENYMSYAPDACQTTFTPRQRERAAATLVNLRANLLGGQTAGVVWVDFSHGGFPLGSFSFPYKTMSAALGAVAPGGRVVIKSSATPAAVTVDQNVILDSFRGTATIGD